jgi:hypothetical protein
VQDTGEYQGFEGCHDLEIAGAKIVVLVVPENAVFSPGCNILVSEDGNGHYHSTNQIYENVI